MTTDITRYGTGPRMSEAVAHNGTLYLAGQLGEPSGSVADQTRQALAAVDAILAKAGIDKTRILMVQIWLADMATFAEMNSVYATMFAEPYPARTTIGVASLPLGARVEIELMAHRPAT